jgi:hypothetical protein
MAQDSRTIARDLSAFEASLRDIPWFHNLGKPHPRDDEVHRISSFDEWRGPEQGYGDWFGRYPAMVQECVETGHASRRAELTAVWDRIERVVIEMAWPNVPGAGEGDAHHGPTACVYDAGYIAALVGWHVLLGLPLPEPIAARWSWLTAGHWPCDYAEEPPGFGDESRIDVSAGKLVVY